MTDTFTLDPRLEQDTLQIADLDLCRARLMNDARFPWLILVPRKPGLTEIDQLDRTQRMQLLDEMERCGHALRACAIVDKLNIGALGNIVQQLHVHVVARTRGDEAWPGPVWGYGAPQRYTDMQADELLDLLAKQLVR